jgi:L-ascorbate metabolism protein UlaG (beta-lactamase superfamily)
MYRAFFTDGLFGSGDRTPPSPLALFADGARELASPPASGLRVTWLGHSTLFIEIDGARVLVDPQWSERASPSTLVGPRRAHPPPIPLASLPLPDVVLVSHDHYDHLDMATVRALAARGVRLLVPLGIGAHLEAWGVPSTSFEELDWDDARDLPGGVRVRSTPARHFSGRALDRDVTLWTSWTLVGPRHRVFYSGDTGMGPHFARIGREHGPFDLTMIESGQAHWSWGDIHLGPEGAVEAHRALGGRVLLPVHWCTFALAYHAWDEPIEGVMRAAADAGVTVATPRPGEPMEPEVLVPQTAWWRASR